jgi:N-acetylmuramoyl-L-alanine amidase
VIVSPRLLSLNLHEGRSGPYPIDAIVIHVTEGDAESVISWFNNPDAKVSAHYMVCKDGRVIRFVYEADTAWHAGQVIAPTSKLVLARKPYSPNSWAIGIEHEGDGTEEMTDAQRAASYALITDIRARRPAILLDRDHIIGHHEVKATKACPGAISVDRIVADLSAGIVA